MKTKLIAAIAGTILTAAAFGQTSTLPPVSSVTLPPVQPGSPVLLVLPVLPPGDGSMQWASKSIQQDMVADLSEMTHAEVIAPANAKAASDEAGALDQARQFDAKYVVYSTAQVSNNQLRVTGQVIDTATGKPLGSIKATAPTDNLFPLEDSLAAQTAHALPTSVAIVAPLPQTQPTANGTEPPQYTSQPLPTNPLSAQATQAPLPATPPTPSSASIDNNSPYYSYTEALPPTYYTYNSYYYPYYYPYAYWGYPYYWGPYWGVGFGYYGWGGGFYHRGFYGGRGYYGHGFYGRGGVGHGFGGGHFGGGGGRR